MKRVFSLLLSLSLSGYGLSAAADDDHDYARKLVESGEIVSLETLLDKNAIDKRWRVLEVELETEDDRIVYELEVLDENGRVRELIYDAKTGKFIGEEDD